MNKFIKICIFFVFTMLLNTGVAYAQLDVRIQNAADQLHTLEILKGKEDGDLALNDKITRAEIATLILRVTAQENVNVPNLGPTKHADVVGHWAEANINKAVHLGYMKGYSDVEFGPNNNITYAEVVTLMIRLIGEEKNLVGQWPNAQIEKAKVVGVINDDTLFDASRYNEDVTRGMVALLLYDTMTLNTNIN